MSQSIVTVRLNGQPYQMGCDAGQEAHIEALGRDVKAVLNELLEQLAKSAKRGFGHGCPDYC